MRFSLVFSVPLTVVVLLAPAGVLAEDDFSYSYLLGFYLSMSNRYWVNYCFLYLRPLSMYQNVPDIFRVRKELERLMTLKQRSRLKSADCMLHFCSSQYFVFCHLNSTQFHSIRESNNRKAQFPRKQILDVLVVFTTAKMFKIVQI